MLIQPPPKAISTLAQAAAQCAEAQLIRYLCTHRGYDTLPAKPGNTQRLWAMLHTNCRRPVGHDTHHLTAASIQGASPAAEALGQTACLRTC